MLRVFGHYVRVRTLLLSLFEWGLLGSIFYALASVLLMRGVAPDADQRTLMAAALLTGTLMSLLLFSFGAYEEATHQSSATLLQRLTVVSMMGCVATLVVNHFLLGASVPPLAAVVGVGASFFAILGTRMTLRHSGTIDPLAPRILVLGSGHRAEALRQVHLKSALKNTELKGFLAMTGRPGDALNAVEAVPPAMILRLPGGNLKDYAQSLGVTEIVVAMDDRRGALPVSDLLDCKMHGIRVTDSTTFCEREAGKVDLDNVYPSWLIFSEGFRRSAITAELKRLLDIAIAVPFLLLVLPLLILTVIAIKLDSPGPIFYRQTRTGLNGRPFSIFKFRSMTVDAERNGAQWAAQGDKRVTRVGAFIRKTRIDEIPQLINVLRGEMSFVGPRPERPEFVAKLAAEIPFYHDRHRVKPGITGWAQINYPYGASIEDTRQKLTYDLYYMKNYSLFLDLVIILKTARVVIWPDGVR